MSAVLQCLKRHILYTGNSPSGSLEVAPRKKKSFINACFLWKYLKESLSPGIDNDLIINQQCVRDGVLNLKRYFIC